MTLKTHVDQLTKELACLNHKLRTMAVDPAVTTMDWYRTAMEADAVRSRLSFVLREYKELVRLSR